MKIRIYFLLSLFAAGTFSVVAQNKLLSIEDAILRQRSTLGPQFLSGLGWLPDSHAYWYYGTKNGKRCLVIKQATKQNIDTISLDDLNKALNMYNNIFNKTEDPIEPFADFPAIYAWQNSVAFRFLKGRDLFSYTIKNQHLYIEHRLPEENGDLDLNTPSGKIAYNSKGILYVKSAGSEAIALNDGSEKDVSYGKVVHRNEFGINKGTFWSPDAGKLAFYRMDESMVSNYTVYNFDGYPNTSTSIKYPVAGAASHHVTIGVYDLKKNSAVYLNTGEPFEQYLTNIAWSADNKFVYVAVLNRAQNQMQLKKFDAQSGLYISTLFEEKHEKYVEPENPMHFLPGKGGNFIWESERDGFNHLYLYDKDGRLLKQLTQGNWLVTQFLGFDAKGQTAFFMANKTGPLDNGLFSVNVNSGVISELAAKPGQHRCLPSTDKKYWIDIHSNAQIPANTSLLDEKGKQLDRIMESKNPLAAYDLAQTTVFSIKAADDKTDLYCRVIKPRNFDSTKKYPVVTYVYGGPHLQIVKNTWLYGSDLWMQYMAQQGYVVFSLDNRGSDNRGLEFENATHQNLGNEEMADQLKGREWLVQQSYVDSNKMAIFGWSFGGFMTTSLMTRYPGKYQVGIAGGPVIDWGLYEIMYTERYMRTPNENPEGYKESNLLNHISNLQGKLMLIHGTSDDVVLWQHSLMYLKESIKKGIQLDYFVYPGHQHNVFGKDRVHLYQKVTDYINQNLSK